MITKNYCLHNHQEGDKKKEDANRNRREKKIIHETTVRISGYKPSED